MTAMKKLYTCTLLLAAAVAAASAAPPPSAAAGDEKALGVSIGATVDDFKLPDASGKDRTLSSLRGKGGTVLIFVSVQCPVSNAYNARMETLARDYRARGVSVVGINSNATEPADAVGAHAAEKGLTFPILKDRDNRLADRLGAQVTPEVFFLDASNKLVYRGRIDNSRSGDAVTSDDLRDAIEATLAGRAVSKTEARAFGCSIKRAS